MAVLSALRRFARLGLWVGLSAGAMLVDACSSGLRSGSRDSAADVPAVPASQDAGATPDADRAAQPVDAQAVDADQVQPADGGQTDLWDTICE